MTTDALYDPIHSIAELETYLSKHYYKKPYDRFMWWRSYTPKTQPLKKGAGLEKRVLNGDFDQGPFSYEVELVEHKLNQAYQNLYPDVGRFHEEQSVNLARRKRLKEDFQKDEERKLEAFFEDFCKHFLLERELLVEELEAFNGDTVKDFFFFLKEKYSWK